MHVPNVPARMALLLGLATAGLGAPQTYKVGPGSTVTFQASSTAHDFEGETDALSGTVSWDPAAPEAASGKVFIQSAELKTGVAGRDRDMRRKALETGKFPTIVFAMSRFLPAAAAAAGAGPVDGHIHGELQLHGVKGKLAIPATVAPAPDGGLLVTGRVDLDMTDWGIDPPVNRILFVKLTVAKGVTVGFELHLVPAPELAPPAVIPGHDAATAAEKLAAIRAARQARGH